MCTYLHCWFSVSHSAHIFFHHSSLLWILGGFLDDIRDQDLLVPCSFWLLQSNCFHFQRINVCFDNNWNEVTVSLPTWSCVVLSEGFFNQWDFSVVFRAVRTLTFMSHLDCLVGGVVVDEDSCGIVGSCFKDLFFKGTVSSLQQRHPVDSPRRNQETSVGVAALSVHHWGDAMKPGLLFVTFTFKHCFNLRPELRRMSDKENDHSLNMLAVTLRGRLCCVQPITHKPADFTTSWNINSPTVQECKLYFFYWIGL